MRKSREPRVAVNLLCRMRRGDGWHDVRIRNVSSRGLGAMSATPPALGQYVEVRRGSAVIIARVVWLRDCSFGLRTQDKIDLTSLVERAPANDREPGQAAPDRRKSPREGDFVRAAERSRRASSTLQYAVLAMAGLTAALFMSSVVRQIFSTPVAAATDALGRAGADPR